MSIIKATKTLAAIESAIAADQGASYRINLQKVLPHIGDAYRGDDGPFRSHLGASVIGSECGRAVWYGFRWFTRKRFSGRILRLFNRGHLEEGRFIAILLTIGIQVYQQDANGKQFRISAVGGHFGGSGDGVGIGIPDLSMDTPCLLEFKTHSSKSFAKLAADGVRVSKFDHFVQMQMYLRKMGLAVALYMAVNKDNDEIWAELVYLDSALADQYIDRAHNIVMSNEPPKKISNSAGWYACKFCDHKEVCHAKGTPDRNCRTCIFSKPREDGKWYCTRAGFGDRGRELTTNEQLTGCEGYQAIK